jgi:predicted alpha/beta superfamily hydrolase
VLMKLVRRIALLALLAVGAPAAGAPPTPAVPAGRPIQTAVSYELASAILADTRQINIWVPPDYERSQVRYPVLYLLDGALDQDFHHIAGLAQLASLSWTFGPFIVVGVQTKGRTSELTPTATDPRYLAAFPESGGAERFRRFLQEEVIPFIEQRLRAGPRRALMGESLAGLFVVDTLLRQPELFQDFVAISPSLWWDDRRFVRSAAAQLDPQRLRGRRLYLAVADEGGTMQSGVDLLRAAAAREAPALSVRYSDRSGFATHATVYHGAAEDALRWLYPAPPHNPGPTVYDRGQFGRAVSRSRIESTIPRSIPRWFAKSPTSGVVICSWEHDHGPLTHERMT